MTETAQIYQNAAVRFRRVAASPAADRLPLVLIALAGASFIPSSKVVHLVSRVLLPEWSPLALTGFAIFSVAMVGIFVTKSKKFSDSVRRSLFAVAGALVLCSPLVPLISLLIYWFAEPGPSHRYFVTRDPDIATQVFLADRDGHVVTLSAWNPRWSFRAHECIDASQVGGAMGLSWTRIDAMIPPPQHGQLWWDIPPADCFAAQSIAQLADR